MCACDFNFTCPRCRGTRFDPAYLLDDPEPNDPLEADQDVRPAEYGGLWRHSADSVH